MCARKFCYLCEFPCFDFSRLREAWNITVLQCNGVREKKREEWGNGWENGYMGIFMSGKINLLYRKVEAPRNVRVFRVAVAARRAFSFSLALNALKSSRCSVIKAHMKYVWRISQFPYALPRTNIHTVSNELHAKRGHVSL